MVASAIPVVDYSPPQSRWLFVRHLASSLAPQYSQTSLGMLRLLCGAIAATLLVAFRRWVRAHC